MKLLNKSNLSNIVILLVFAALIFSPQAKGLVIQGLMQIGFFQPSVPEENTMVSNSNVTNSPILFTSESGTLLDLHSLKGKVVFINFWATWCPPCIAEMPSINQLSKQFKNNKTAWNFFEKQAPSYKKVMIHWIMSAKQEKTQLARLEKIIPMILEGKGLNDKYR